MERRTRAGDATTPVLIWTVTLAATILLVGWYVTTTRGPAAAIDRVNEDLKNLHESLALACTYAQYQDDLALKTRAGNLTITTTKLCIAVDTAPVLVRCVPTPCDVLEASFDLETAGTLRIRTDADAIAVTAVTP